MKKSMELFLTFFKIGLFTFGGGYAMIPLIEEQVVKNKHWMRREDLLDVTAIAESTPGPIAINAATFVGSKVAGFSGALAATFGVVIPSFGIIYVISFVLKQFSHLKVVQYAFAGIRAGVLALIILALVSMFRACPKKAMDYLIMAFALLGIAVFRMNAIYVILLCALIGVITYLKVRE